MHEIVTKPFSLTQRDYRGMLVYSAVRGLVTWPMALVTLPNLFVLPFLFVGGEINAETWPTFAIAVAVVAAISLIVLPALAIVSILNGLKKIDNATATRVARLHVDYLALEGDGFAHRLVWQNFRYAAAGRDAIYLITRTNSGYVILNSAFETAENRTQFIALAQKYIAANKNRQAVVFGDTASEPWPDARLSPLFRLGFGPLYVVMLHSAYQMFLRPWLFVVATAVIGAINIFYSDLEPGAVTWATEIWHAALGVAILLIVGPLFLGLTSVLIHGNNPIFKGMRHVEISERGLRLVSQTNDASMAWHDVKKVTRRFGVLLFIPKPRGVIPVPVSAFPDTAAAKAFYDQAVTWWKAAQAVKASGPAAKTTLDVKG